MTTIVTANGVDITEGVQVLYDTVVASLDWGSGFLSNDEARQIIKTAEACGFVTPKEAAEKFASYGNAIECWVCGQMTRRSYWSDTSREHYDAPEYDHEPVVW